MKTGAMIPANTVKRHVDSHTWLDPQKPLCIPAAHTQDGHWVLTEQFVYEALCWEEAWSGGEGWGSKCEKLVLVLKTFPMSVGGLDAKI